MSDSRFIALNKLPKWRFALLWLTLSLLGACAHSPAEKIAGHKPNILYIVADDLGYSDIGAFGGEIQTPNLDELVNQGRILTNYHTSTMCAVTRSMLYSGTDHHLVGQGSMGAVNDERKGLPGYEDYLNNRALSIAELLHDAGYHTYIAGKWHLGSKINSKDNKTPDQWGFERSFTLLGGATDSHYGHDLADAKTYTENGHYVALPAKDAQGQPWYDSNVYTQKLIANIDEQIKDGKPFAAFATYTSPHWPLQVPEPWASQYRGVYDVGYAAIREQRLSKQKQLGFVPQDYTEASERLPNVLKASASTAGFNKPGASYLNADSVLQERKDDVDYGPGYANPDWNSLTPDQKQVQARYMELYAGMVSNLDYNIGLLIQHLKEIGQYENTFIVFHSDNGPEGYPLAEQLEAVNARNYAVLGKDQSLNPPGSEKTYVQYGRRWAEVSATPFRLVKGFTTEGGHSVPTVVHLPGQSVNLPPIRLFTHVTDIAPTLLELAGVQEPKAIADEKGVNGLKLVKYKDRNVYPISGHSLLAVLQGESEAEVHPEPVGEELYGRAFLRSGQWKIVWIEPPTGPQDGHWQLYDLQKDRTEVHDVSAQHPEIVRDLYEKWQSYLHDSGALLAKKPGSGGRRVPQPR